MALALNFKPDLRSQLARFRSGVVFPKPEMPDVILAIGAVSLVGVCLGLLGVPAFHSLQMRAKGAAVVGNAATVQLAAETYAASHGGRFATDALDLLPYLPADRPPINPYSHAEIEFRGLAGDLTYQSPSGGDDYIIKAFAMGPGGRPKLVETLTDRRDR